MSRIKPVGKLTIYDLSKKSHTELIEIIVELGISGLRLQEHIEKLQSELDIVPRPGSMIPISKSIDLHKVRGVDVKGNPVYEEDMKG